MIEKRENQEYVYLYSFYNTEEEIAFRINRLQKSKNIKRVSNLNSETQKSRKKYRYRIIRKTKRSTKVN